MILSRKGIIKALVSLCGCAGWSVPLLFANLRRQVFSRQGPYGISQVHRKYDLAQTNLTNVSVVILIKFATL